MTIAVQGDTYRYNEDENTRKTAGVVSWVPAGRDVTVTFTPAAAAYLAGDTMDVAKEIALIGPTIGGSINIISTELMVEHTAVISGETSYTLHLYSVTPPSALADNAVWDIPSGDRASYLGSLALGTPVDVGSTLYVQTLNIQKQVKVPVGGSLFAYLVTNGPFTATAAIRRVTIHAQVL